MTTIFDKFRMDGQAGADVIVADLNGAAPGSALESAAPFRAFSSVGIEAGLD